MTISAYRASIDARSGHARQKACLRTDFGRSNFEMHSLRPAIESRRKPAALWRTDTHDEHDVAANGDALIRLLVLDENAGTPVQIENALWIWPHRVSAVSSIKDAVKLCRHLAPTAIVASLSCSENSRGKMISRLREKLPSIPIVAVGSEADASSPWTILDLGADAVLSREELARPTLHELLKRLRRVPETTYTSEIPMVAKMPLPWRDSQILGSLICDIEGRITIANECLARWLAYSSASAMHGKSVWRDVLESHSDWPAWKLIAGDLDTMLHQSITLRTGNGQRRYMKVQIFAVPDSPTCIQAVFVDQTELITCQLEISDFR